MPLPTLLKKGSIVGNNEEHRAEVENYVAIDYVIEWLKTRRGKVGIDNRILVLKSDTGSGKSTAFPAILYERLFDANSRRGIAVTQPRILTTISIVKDQLAGSPFYPFLVAGENIGWQTGPDKKLPKYGLTFMTIGTLTEQMKAMSDEEIIQKYEFIIIDEVHEASLPQTMLLIAIKAFLRRNANNEKLPFVILTSATLVPSKFLTYFGVDNPPRQPNLINVAGFAYKLNTNWIFDKSVSNYVKSAAMTAINIHKNGLKDDLENRDILVFMPGMKEIDEAKGLLSRANEELAKNDMAVFIILAVDRQAVLNNTFDNRNVNVSADELTVKIAGKMYKPFRKIIVSTSVAETGLTIDMLKYVVDPGYHRGPEFHCWPDAKGIVTKPAPVSRLKQRQGRCNRKSPGEYYPLFPKYIYESLPQQQLADIEVSDIGEIFMSCCMEQLKLARQNGQTGLIRLDFDFDTIDKVPLDAKWLYIEKCYLLGLVSPISDYVYKQPVEADNADLIDAILAPPPDDEYTLSVTRLGALSSLFMNLRIEGFKMIMSGYFWNINITDLVTIASFISFGKDKWGARQGSEPKWPEIYYQGLPSYLFPAIREEHNGPEGGSKKAKKPKKKSGPKLPPEIMAQYIRLRYYLADDFLAGLILFEAFGAELAKHGYQDYIPAMKAWAEKHDINYETLAEFLAFRDEIINKMVFYGLNINVGHKFCAALPEEFINWVSRAKMCIYEGHKCNLLTYDDSAGKYVNKHGLPIKFQDLFADNEFSRHQWELAGMTPPEKPKYVLVDSFTIKEDRKKPGVYMIKSGYVSYLDGFVDVDLDFDLF